MDISPDKQNINAVFSSTTYHIDFYQRDYRWTSEPVLRLLDDVFFKFEETYDTKNKLTADQAVIEEHYPWYYLNTYVTNKVGGKVFIVDGQQRLTTLSLILTKLYHLTGKFESKLDKWLDGKIVGHIGANSQHWMNHEGHQQTQERIYSNELEGFKPVSGITAENMITNYGVISGYLDKKLGTQHKFESFVFYFLYRLVLINLSVEQTDVPMVFEVINDRGVKLQPYEILKGKLLGQLEKSVLEQRGLNAIWEDNITAINAYGEDEADDFFRYFLKAKFADTRKDGQSFDGDYHRQIFANEFKDKLEVVQNPTGVIQFLEGNFSNYARLYEKCLEAFDDEEQGAFAYNSLNSIDGAFLFVQSSCKNGDHEEQEKLEQIPYEMDRIFSLLQLQGAYDSNSFQQLLYQISAEIREKEVSVLRPAFDKYLINEVNSRRNTETDNPFKYTYFKQAGINLNVTFKRYFLARVEEFMSQGLNDGMKHSVRDLVKKRATKDGFHIEHILSYNDDNLALFDDDEDRFDQERNRLGGLLLLKGKDNISSNNETFEKKLKTYAGTLYWNETLHKDTYKSKIDLRNLIKKHSLAFEPVDKFGPEELEARHKLLFEISKIIWA